MENDRDLLRVAIMIGGAKSSISMDGRLAYYLGLKMGGEPQVRTWVRETVNRLEREWAAAAEKTDVGCHVRVNTSMSRAIQREALDELFRDLALSVPTVPSESNASLEHSTPTGS